MNLTIRGRLWQILWQWWGMDRGVRTGIYPRPHPCAVFRWWSIGPLHFRRFYHAGEYGRLYPTPHQEPRG